MHDSNDTLGVAVFLVIAFGGAWLSWLIPWRLDISPRNPWFQLSILPGGFMPALAAVVCRLWVTRERFADARLGLNLRAWRIYLFAWLLPLVVAIFVTAVVWITGLDVPDFSLRRLLQMYAPGQPLPARLPSWIGLAVVPQILVTAVFATPLLFGEEFGWRGYLQVRWLRGRPLAAGIATGLVWGVWHYPLILLGYQFPNDRLAGLAVFPVGTVLLSVVFGWVYARSRSIWAVCLAHSATNAAGASMLTMYFAGSPNWLWIAYLGVLPWLPLGAVCLWLVATGRLAPDPD